MARTVENIGLSTRENSTSKDVVKTFRFLGKVLIGAALGAIALPIAAAAIGIGIDVSLGAGSGALVAIAVSNK